MACWCGLWNARQGALRAAAGQATSCAVMALSHPQLPPPDPSGVPTLPTSLRPRSTSMTCSAHSFSSASSSASSAESCSGVAPRRRVPASGLWSGGMGWLWTVEVGEVGQERAEHQAMSLAALQRMRWGVPSARRPAVCRLPPGLAGCHGRHEPIPENDSPHPHTCW